MDPEPEGAAPQLSQSHPTAGEGPGRRFALSLGGLCICAAGIFLGGLAGYLLDDKSLPLAACAGNLGLVLLIQLLMGRRLGSLLCLGRGRLKEELSALSLCMTQLAQGNLSTHLAFNREMQPGSLSREANDLAELFNTIDAGLSGIAREYNTVIGTPSLRLCYVGPDSFSQGRLAGKLMGVALGGRGEVAISTGKLHSNALELRRKGFRTYLEENFPEITIVETAENGGESGSAERATEELLERHEDLAGIYVTEGATPPGVAGAVDKAGLSEQVKIICHDLLDETIGFLEQGIISATLADSSFAQGHDPVIHLYNHIVSGWMPDSQRLVLETDVVTAANCRQFWREGVGVLLAKAVAGRLAKPCGASPGRRLRIAVLGCENSSCWDPIKAGVLKAAEELAPLGAAVDWLAPPLGAELTSEACGPMVEGFIREGYDGMALAVDDCELLRKVNRAVEAGIPVITYVTEPSGLRSFISTMADQTGELMLHSETLAGNARRVNMTNAEIVGSMKGMAEGIGRQNLAVSTALVRLASLLKHIRSVDERTREGREAAEETRRGVLSAAASLGKNRAGADAIGASVSATARIVDELQTHSKKIDGIVDIINDITAQVNILAINAAIEASHSAGTGKGFMVVAAEMRKLASSTDAATRQIAEQIAKLKGDIVTVDEVSAAVAEKVEESATLTEDTAHCLARIETLVQGDKSRLEAIGESIASTKLISDELDEAMTSLASLSADNAAAVEMVCGLTSRLEDNFEKVALSARSLHGMAQTEKHLIANFTYAAGE